MILEVLPTKSCSGSRSPMSPTLCSGGSEVNTSMMSSQQGPPPVPLCSDFREQGCWWSHLVRLLRSYGLPGSKSWTKSKLRNYILPVKLPLQP